MNYPYQQLGLYDSAFEHDGCGVGFVCNVKGEASFDVVQKGIKILRRLSHRGAVGADPETGDGAGLLIQLPHKFFQRICASENITLPSSGDYGAGLIFLPQNAKEQKICRSTLEKTIKKEGQELLGWRKVPTDNALIGKTARETEPVIEQVFIARGKAVKSKMDFERKLYLIRKQTESIISTLELKQKSFFYITNLSTRTLSYKGLLMPEQLGSFFPDLQCKDLKSAICLVHSRYSTNTFPTWDLAQPFRFLAHNGEINTLRGNINWMRAREGQLESELFGADIEKIKPVIVPGGSDSATLDNVFELLVLSGRSLPEAMMMLIPEAWEQNKHLDKKLKDFYRYHACFMEPWDGPAAVAFTDGKHIGAVLDRNGLRPARYLVTKSGLVVMASEVGVLDIKPEDIQISGRLEPGKIFFIDTETGKIVNNDQIKETLATQRPYGKWLREHLLSLEKVSMPPKKKLPQADISFFLKIFGYTREDVKVLIKPMAEEGTEPIGSMGNDTPLALLSQKPQLLYNYFKQLFAQVTNPAIDPIREELVMSLEGYLGREKNVLGESPLHCHKLYVKNPILSDEELEKIRCMQEKGFKAKTISLLFPASKEKDFREALKKICREAEVAVRKNFSFIVLSDRGVSKKKAPLPALLAVGAVHQHLIKKGLRTQVSLILESAEPREVHHFAVLFGYGADCVNPYLVYQLLEKLTKERELKLSLKKATENYHKALDKGILKILSKMGISTLRSYRGGQIFEALGLGEKVINQCFTGTASRIGGMGFKEIFQETLLRHQEAYVSLEGKDELLPSGGVYQWRSDGEAHLWNPESIAALQDATRRGDYSRYRKFSELINNQAAQPITLRSLLTFKQVKPIPLTEVEPVEAIFRRFATGAMSFGSISKGAHYTLALAMNKIKGRSNTGEGGEDPVRFTPLPSGDSARSAIKQIASGRFGVATNYLVNADEIQIKIAQGAKPGEGGQLPGHKVSSIIARIRYTTPGVTLISPPPHHDIYSIEDLAQLIFDLKNVNPRARISVKLVSEAGVGTIAAGVAKGHADMILISGGDGGTGASPKSSIRHAGLPWELGLAETHQTLVLNDLRSRVRLQTDGQMRTGRDVAIAAALGAEEYGFCTAPLIVMGCVMLRHCHLNNCSLGVATQDELLQERFRGKVEEVVNYFHFVAEELREIMARLGIKKVEELIGRTDLLEPDTAIIPLKSKGIDFNRILYKPKVSSKIGTYFQKAQNHNLDKVLDQKLIQNCREALEKGSPVKLSLSIQNTQRTTGAMLSGELCRRYGEMGLPQDTISCKFTGVSGQSFGAWLAKGITFELEGLANDYVGKGISGGKIIIYPYRKANYQSAQNILIGNTCFYGAISGEAYISGAAGERFCIRNSGLRAVVEGVGDHGCEYMTGGRVVILGETGRNFGAGMSGGIAYIYDEQHTFKDKCNLSMVKLEKITQDDCQTIEHLLHNHYQYTRSARAKKVLDNFSEENRNFVKVMPLEYKRILAEVKMEEKLGLSEVSDG